MQKYLLLSLLLILSILFIPVHHSFFSYLIGEGIGNNGFYSPYHRLPSSTAAWIK